MVSESLIHLTSEYNDKMAANGGSQHVVFDDDVDMADTPSSIQASSHAMHPERMAAIARDPGLKPVDPAQPKVS